MASSLLLQLIFALATYQDLLNAKAELVIVDGSAYAGSARIVGDADQDAEMSEELINSMTPDAPSHFEGDIVLTDGQRAELEAETGKPFNLTEPQRAVTRNENGLWPDGKVPYYISSRLGNRARSAIEAAINAYSASTCIQFYPKGSEKDYVYFFKGSGCYSSVGRVGGSQRISIGSGCEHRGIVIHEIFHALGRWHEQSRPDRDQYITVNYQNMRDGVESNFFKFSSSRVTTQGVSYDYGSIMHYSAYAFSRNGKPTIEVKDRSIRNSVLGQRSGLSAKDLQHIDALYCDSIEPVSWSSWGKWSECSRSCNGGIRSRLRTCEGGTTCTGSNYQQESCNTQLCPQAGAEWGQWGSWSGCSLRCGGGRQSRTRQCLNGNICSGTRTQYRDCNEQACPGPDIDGLQYEGCSRVVASYGLFLLDGRFNYLRDDPFKRTRAVEKCAQAASQLSFSVMAVAAGYCISGNNRVSDYTRFPSSRCKDGRGAYRKGSFYMDVYTITDPGVFFTSDEPTVLSNSTEANDQTTDHSSPTSGTQTLNSVTSLIITTLSSFIIALLS